jgi:2-succinyl-6-hydroxy-2,4-cyclohexadiene-1-carboxylate synthase
MVLVPGFTQTACSWDPVIAALRGDVESIALDVPTGLTFVDTAHTLGDAGGAGTYAGYSAGGRLCLQLALDRPELVDRDGLDAFLDRWLAQPLFASLPREAAELEVRERDPAVLTHALRALGQGTQEPLWDRLQELRMPVTLVVGALDDKYTDIARAVARHIVAARVHVIGGAGHALHLEQPEALADLMVS